MTTLKDIKNYLLALVDSAVQVGIDKIRHEPVVVTGIVIAGIINIAGALNIVVDEVALQTTLAPIIASIIARAFAVPANEVETFRL